MTAPFVPRCEGCGGPVSKQNRSGVCGRCWRRAPRWEKAIGVATTRAEMVDAQRAIDWVASKSSPADDARAIAGMIERTNAKP